MKIIIAGGGTGGHLYPGIAIAEEIKNKEPDTEIIFVGKKSSLEEIIAKKHPAIQFFYGINAKGFKLGSYLNPLNFSSLIYSLVSNIRDSFYLLRNVKPKVVIGTGGYVSFSLLFAAQIKRIPNIILEQNAYPGLANFILGKKANKIAVAYPSCISFFPKSKVYLTGNPVRNEIKLVERREAFSYFNLKEDISVVLFLGGSQGSEFINRIALEVAQYFISYRNLRVHFLLSTGDRGYKEAIKKEKELRKKKYKGREAETLNILTLPYISEIKYAYSIADLIISRAGAISLAEIIHCGKASILIPYPYARNKHQERNARFLEQYGAAEVFLENEITGEKLAYRIQTLLSSPEKLKQIEAAARLLDIPNAREKIYNLIKEFI